MIQPAPAGLTVHGGRLDEAARRWPLAPAPWLDLSTGINPVAWDGDHAPPDTRALPTDAALAGLLAAAAAAFGASHLPIAALPGSEAGLRLLATIDPPRPWRIVTPGYATHAAALPGATAIDADTVADEARRGGTILLANPNNPDGRLWAAARLLAIARTLAQAGGLMVVDEAFADAVAGASVLPSLAAGDRVLVYRSFGKFYGLAGLRLGFAAGAGDMVAALAGRTGSWPVSAAAIAIGTAAYRDRDWAEAARVALTMRAQRLDAVLGRAGLVAEGTCPLFRHVRTPHAAALFERLAQAGILVRPFADAPDRLRFGVPGSDADLDRLARALGDG